MARVLPLLTLTAALALPATAGAATFTAPETHADWPTGAAGPAAARGAVAWIQTDGVHVLSGGDLQHVFTQPAGTLRLAAAPDGPVAAWAAQDGPYAWARGAAVRPAAADARTRAIAVAPFLAAWVGVTSTGAKEIQVAHRDPGSSAFHEAQTLAEPGRTSYGLVAAGDATGRALLGWHSLDEDDQRRIVTSDGAGAGAFLTDGSTWDANPSVAMAPDGTGLIAWGHGKINGRIQAAVRAPDGTFGPIRTLDTGGGATPPVAAAGADGTLAVAWRAGATVFVATRAPGATEFGAPEALGGESPTAQAVTVGDDGTVLVAWTDLPSGGDYQTDGYIVATARAAQAESFSSPVVLSDRYVAGEIAAAGDRVVWSERRVVSDGVEGRVRSARLTSATADGQTSFPGQGTDDDTAPTVRMRYRGVAHGYLRVSVRANERAAAQLLAAGNRHRTAGLRVALKSGVARVVRARVPRGARRVRLTLRVTDDAGNTRTVRRTARVKRRR